VRKLLISLIIILLFIIISSAQDNVNMNETKPVDQMQVNSTEPSKPPTDQQSNGMDPLTRDVIDAVSKIAAVISVFVAIIVASSQINKNRKDRNDQIKKDREQKEKEIDESIRNREQREEELRWKQAKTAKEIIDNIHYHEWAKNAVTMLDWSKGEHDYEIRKGSVEVISYENDVIPALGKAQRECEEKDRYIVNCFDWFLSFIDHIEHCIRTRLIDFEDVKDVFKPYAEKIKTHRIEYDRFMTTHYYLLALDFWKRYDA
jgi:uncharacterized protein YxeA